MTRSSEHARQQVEQAAIQLFSKFGFEGVSMRDVERFAGVNRGLASYHFPTKDDLWRAAVCWLMDRFHEEMQRYADVLQVVNPNERARVLLRIYVRFAAKYPQYYRLVILEGGEETERSNWLASEHVRRHIDFFSRMSGHGDLGQSEREAIGYYSLLGAASTIFAVPAQCRVLFGVDPHEEGFVDRMADQVADMYLNNLNLADAGGSGLGAPDRSRIRRAR